MSSLGQRLCSCHSLCLEYSSQFSALELLLIPQDLTEKVPLTGSPPEPWAVYTTHPLSLGAQTTQTHLVGACPTPRPEFFKARRSEAFNSVSPEPDLNACLLHLVEERGALPCDLLAVSHRRASLGKPVIATLRPGGRP